MPVTTALKTTNLKEASFSNTNASPYEYREKHSYYNSEPTSRDYDETRRLLRDFDIKDSYSITIPNFKSRNELFRWRLNLIKERLE